MEAGDHSGWWAGAIMSGLVTLLPPAAAFAVGWDDVRTVDFEEYKDAPRVPVGNDPWIDVNPWTPPDGWTDPIFHRKESFAFTASRGFGPEWTGPRPDTFDLTQWAKRQKTRGEVLPFGPEGITRASGASFLAGLNLQSIDVGVDFSDPLAVQQPAAGHWQGVVHGYREDLSAGFGSPERWVEVYRKPFELPPVQTTRLGSGNATSVTNLSQFTTVELPGWTQLDRIAVSASDPQLGSMDYVAVDNVRATAGATHAFFLGAPDMQEGVKIDARRDGDAVLAAMERMFNVKSWQRLTLPDINAGVTTQAAATADIFSRLDTIKGLLAPGDNFVFHYSGHGVQLRDPDGPNPLNTDEALFLGYGPDETPAYLIDDALADYFRQDPIWAQVDKTFVLDACHAGGFWTSTPDAIADRGREKNRSGASDLATLPKTALLAAAPEYRQGLSFQNLSDLNDVALPGTEDFQLGQGLLTAAFVSALQRTDEGFALADLNEDGLSFREILEWVRVSDANELFGDSAAREDRRLAQRALLLSSKPRPEQIKWFFRSRFVGFERSLDHFPWSETPIDIDIGAFGAFTDDFGTAGMMELMTALEIEERLTLGGLEGDYSGNGQVEQGDLDLVLQNWGGARGDWANADGFATPTVDQEELDAVLQNWGGTAAPRLDRTPLPEPAFAGALLSLAAWRRRNR